MFVSMPTAATVTFSFSTETPRIPLVFRWKITAAVKTQINLFITRTTFFRTYKQKECPQVWKLISVNTDSLVINFFLIVSFFAFIQLEFVLQLPEKTKHLSQLYSLPRKLDFHRDKIRHLNQRFLKIHIMWWWSPLVDQRRNSAKTRQNPPWDLS